MQLLVYYVTEGFWTLRSVQPGIGSGVQACGHVHQGTFPPTPTCELPSSFANLDPEESRIRSS